MKTACMVRIKVRKRSINYLKSCKSIGFFNNNDGIPMQFQYMYSMGGEPTSVDKARQLRQKQTQEQKQE